MKKLVLAFLFILFSFSGILAQTLNFDYSNAYVGKETVFVNKSVLSEEVITVAWDLNGNGVYNNGWGDTVNFVYPSTGVYSVGLRITVQSLESYEFIKEIEIGHDLIVNFDYEIACVGNATSFISTSESTDVIVSQEWDFNNDGLFNDASGSSLNFLFPAAGTYNVGLRIATQTGLAKALYRQVVVADIPLADFSASNTCVGNYTEFTNLSIIRADDAAEYVWKFGDGSDWSTVSNPIHTYNSPGIYNVTLIVNSSFGCSNTTVKNVSIKPIPDFYIEFSGDTVFTEGESITVNAIGDFDQAIWSNGVTGNSVVLTEGGGYTVEVSKDGCLNSASFSLQVIDKVGITNLFTPNGDGYNEYWKIFHIENLIPCSVSIYDRSGAEVYSTTNYLNDWNGTYNGQPLPEGTYYYILKCNDGIVKKGAITIIR